MSGFALKPSQFNVKVMDYPEPGKHLLYNTLSTAVAAIDNKGLELLSTLEDVIEPPQSVSQNEQSLTFISALKKQGFLVPREWKEGERYLQFLQSTNNQKGGKLEVTLLTTLSRCIHKCLYCFQKEAHIGGRLKDEDSDKVVAFIKKQCMKLEVEKLWVCYYGSEPLMNQQVIFDTATELQRFCQRSDIHFQFGMVTSGYLLTRALVEQLLPLGFVHAQITIDGTKETHDATRPLQSGKGTYDRITQNLEAYAGLIHTEVLSVIHKDRIPAVYQLIDGFVEKGLASRKVRMTFSPESPDYSADTIQANNQMFSQEGTKILTAEKELLVEIAKLSIYAYQRGLFDNLLPQRTWCAMQRHDERHLVIEPNGTIRTCPNLIGRDGYDAGHISTGVGGIDTMIQENYQRAAECLTCKYLPICADCRVDNLQKQGDILAPRSHEEEYDLIVPDLVKAYYRGRAS